MTMFEDTKFTHKNILLYLENKLTELIEIYVKY